MYWEREGVPFFEKEKRLKKRLVASVSRSTNIPKKVLSAVYIAFTGDAMAPRTKIQEKVICGSRVDFSEEELKTIFSSEDFLEENVPPPASNSVVPRKSTKTKFEVYFQHVWSVLDKRGLAVDERRHGDITRPSVPFASLKLLMEEVKRELPPDTPVPCETYLRYQFWPRNPHHASTSRYVSRFPITLSTQSRTNRKPHIDGAYGVQLQRFVKEWSSLTRDGIRCGCFLRR